MLNQEEYRQAIQDGALALAQAAANRAVNAKAETPPEQLMYVAIDFIAANKYVEAGLFSLHMSELISDDDAALLKAMHKDFSILMVQAYKRGCVKVRDADIGPETSDDNAHAA